MVREKRKFTSQEELSFVRYFRGLAHSVAEKYEDQGDVEELEVRALEGLVRAMRLYKEEKVSEYKFSTYATWFMKESVEKYLRQEE